MSLNDAIAYVNPGVRRDTLAAQPLKSYPQSGGLVHATITVANGVDDHGYVRAVGSSTSIAIKPGHELTVVRQLADNLRGAVDSIVTTPAEMARIREAILSGIPADGVPAASEVLVAFSEILAGQRAMYHGRRIPPLEAHAELAVPVYQ